MGQRAISELFGLDGRVALVTGGASGLGAMIAQGLHQAGARVYVASRKADASDLPEGLRPISANLATEDGCRALSENLARSEKRLDILVNNAGATWGAPLAEHDDRSWDRVLSLNVKAAFHMVRFLLPMLTPISGDGEPSRVLNVGSAAGVRVPADETYSYAASKAALHELTRHLALRLAPEITVNAIVPGAFATRMTAHAIETNRDRLLSGIPMRRLGDVPDVAAAAIYLSAAAGRWLTGVLLPVDGGTTIPR